MFVLYFYASDIPHYCICYLVYVAANVDEV